MKNYTRYKLLISAFLLVLSVNFTNAEEQAEPIVPQGPASTMLDTQSRATQEQQHNELMRNQNLEENGNKKKIISTSSAMGKSITGLDPSNLTDSEKQLSENFVHQGLIDEKMKEGCEGRDMELACQGREVEGKFLGMKSGMVKALSKAYTMVIGMGGIGGDLTKRSSSETPKKDVSGAEKTDATDKAEKKEESQTDYCKYIAVATEVMATFQQKSSQDNLSKLPTNKNTAQQDMLYRAARSHEERAKNAKIQRNGWGITAVCYTAMLTTAQLDWNLGLKLASSALLTGFFQSEVKNHEKYRDKMIALAEKLPGRGDCNPVTERDCYCAHPTTSNDPKYCMPQLHNRAIATSSIRTTCVNSQLKADPQCACQNTRSCFDKTLLKMAGPAFDNVSINRVKKPFVKMVSGETTDGGGAALDSAAQNAIRKALRKFDSKAKPKGLSKQQLKIAKVISSAGIPSRVAGLLSQKPTSAKGTAFANGNNSTGSFASGYSKRAKSNGNKVISFSGGRGSKSKNRKRSNNSRRARKGKKNYGQKILNFSQKAEAKAEISQNKDRPIFDIISRRYQLSAPIRLDLE